jgi:hypothetical protein
MSLFDRQKFVFNMTDDVNERLEIQHRMMLNELNARQERERLIEEIEKILLIFDPAIRRTQFENIFMAESYQCLFKRKDEIKRRIFGDE